MSPQRLSGRVAVIPVGEAAAARARDLVERLAAEGATIVLVSGGAELEEAGGLATGLGGPNAAAVFHLGDVGDGDLDALVEFLGEMFRLAP